MKIIRASAGTGKTTRLVREYLELLVDHPPHHLAAVTYTRRAAAELKARIYQTLRKGQVEGGTFPSSLNGRQEQLAARVLEAPLDTIHGFSELLLRLAAPLLGLDPGLSVGDPGRLEGWFLEAARGQARVRDFPLDENAEKALLDLFKGRVLAERYQARGEQSAALLALFGEALAVYQARVRHVLHPGDAERLAVWLVSTPKAVARVAERLRAVLVDEYQDTNPMQQALFEGLAAAGVDVRVVGDPKQSIFAFRNAVPEGFVDAARRHGAERLTDSFRHPPAMAEFLNRYVGAMHENGVRGFEHPDPVTGRGPGDPKVRIFEIKRPKGFDMAAARGVEARLAAAILYHWIAQGIPPREIMVLVEQRRYALPLVNELNALGIPYAVQGGTDLFKLREVQELVHLLRYAAGTHAERPTLAALLTGPFVGLSLGQAREVLNESDPAGFLAGRYPEARARLERIEGAFARHPAGHALARIVQDFGYLETLDAQVADSVLYALARVARIDDPAEAAATLESLRAHGEEGRLATGEGETLWITTVHSAKGLQARAVLVFDAGREFDPRKPEVLIRPGSGEVALKGEKAYDELWGEAYGRLEHEWHRLLYVALSRAKERLVVTGSENRKPGARTWLMVLQEVFGDPRLELYQELTPSAANELAERVLRQDAPPVTKPYRAEPVEPPAAFPPALKSPSKAEEDRIPEPDPEAEGLEVELRVRARIVGTLVHAGIERDWKLEELDEVLAGERIFAELPSEEREAVREEVGWLLGRYRVMLEDGRIPPLEAREEDLKEIPAAFTLGGQTWYGIIDRLYRYDGSWFLEDYKTDRAPNPEDHLTQLALYREVVRRARGVEPRVRLVYLATGEVVELEDTVLTEALERVKARA